MFVFKKLLLIILISSQVVACQPNKPVSSPEPSPETRATVALPTPIDTSSPSEYPPPFLPEDQASTEAYPEPSGEGVILEPPNPYPLPGQVAGIPPSGYEPSPNDQGLKRGEVFLEMGDSMIISKESYPIQVSLSLIGNLPTSCHKLRVAVTPADAENRVQVEVYSVVDPDQMCTQVLTPFEANIPLGSYSSGKYSVYVNGGLLGEFGP